MGITNMFSNLGAGLAGSASKESNSVGGRVFSNKGNNVHPTSTPAGNVLQSAKNIAIGNRAMREDTKEVVSKVKGQIAKQNLSEKDTKRANRIINMTAAKDYAKNYVTGGDYAGTGLKRAGVVAARHGAAAGAMLAPRIITGGDLTTNGNGERDIAGIPFV